MDTRAELRDELIAVLGATRELSSDSDRHLAEAFLARVEQQLLTVSRDRARRRRKKPEPLTLLRYGLTLLLAALLSAPVVDFLTTFLNKVMQHLDGGAVPAVYYVVLVFLATLILVTAYLERHSVHVRISRRERAGASFPKA